jgi:hypothetical protein
MSAKLGSRQAAQNQGLAHPKGQHHAAKEKQAAAWHNGKKG